MLKASLARQLLTFSGIEVGGENMLWGPGTLELLGIGRATSNVACTTCIVGGRGPGSGFGTMRLKHTTIGRLGGAVRAQVLVRGGGGSFEAEDVAIDDLDALLEGTRSQMRASDCRVFGQVKDLRAGGELVLNCSSSTL